jgi:DNA-binding HxlR family transcriptional regulator
VTSPAPDVFNANCVSRAVLDRIAHKWPMLVIYALAGRTLRYAELQRRIDGISQKMLTQTLRRMEGDGLVARRVLPTTPPSVEYRLTELGDSLREPLSAICRWAERNGARLAAGATGPAPVA